ncbi:DUF3987 domain-containing protein [Neobacillus drentensis]|uniref:DUF3987 domain-containing protein n=1 Tax=Neobacillus drentensis TaxID=220684 RepID=UPI0030029FC0
MASKTADIFLKTYPIEKVNEVLNEDLNISNLGEENQVKHDQVENLFIDEEDFVNESGAFTPKLRLYPTEEGPAAPAFYGLAGEVVRTIDPHTEADPMATLITFLTAYGNIIGDSAHFTAAARRHPARIFAVVVGATGKGRKGTSLSPVRLIFNSIEPEWEQDHMLSGMSSGEGLIYAVRDEEIKNGEIVDEGIEDKRVLVVEEEFGKVLRIANRVGNTLSAIVREFWDTGSPRTLTKNPLKATNAHLSILGQITQDELKKEISNVDLVNGFANRFLWLMVERSKLLPSGGAFHEIDISPLVNKIKSAVKFGSTAGELKRDKEAEQLWEKVYGPLSTGTGGVIGAVTSRAEAQTMRLACVYALLDESYEIKVIHLMAALDLWKYCFGSARFIFGNQGILKNSRAIKLLDELKFRKDSGKDGMTRTEVREFFHKNLSKNEIDLIVEDLLSNGFIRVDSIRKEGVKKNITKISLTD